MSKYRVTLRGYAIFVTSALTPEAAALKFLKNNGALVEVDTSYGKQESKSSLFSTRKA